MKPLTFPFVLAADAAIDLQLHTIYSDGTWTPEQLLDYLVNEQFGLAATEWTITSFTPMELSNWPTPLPVPLPILTLRA